MTAKKKAKKPAKVSSKRLATIAAKLLDMTDADIQKNAGVSYVTTSWPRFCRELRALAASVLSQTEPVKTAKKARKRYHAIEW